MAMTTMTSAPAPAGQAAPASITPRGASLPRAGSRDGGPAPLRDNYGRLLQQILFWAGAVLLPLGLVVIVLGWYGAANTPYQYDQLSYLVSGGLLGLGLTFCGGFLYFGSWLARIAADQKEASKRLADTLLVLADITSRSAAVVEASAGAVQEAADIPVTAGEGTTIHRRDCALIIHRRDLTPVGMATEGLTACRVCRP